MIEAVSPVLARDIDGRYAQQDPEMHRWFEHLASRKGPCCSDADGVTVEDTDWDFEEGHYRVYLKDLWIVVPDDAVITQPNRYGRTVVWPLFFGVDGRGQIIIRCFMPGPMT